MNPDCHDAGAELEPLEPVLEGVIVGEGMYNGNPLKGLLCAEEYPRHADCTGLRVDFMRMQEMPCECSCHRPHTVEFIRVRN